jgi:hypothetical protein
MIDGSVASSWSIRIGALGVYISYFLKLISNTTNRSSGRAFQFTRSFTP